MTRTLLERTMELLEGVFSEIPETEHALEASRMVDKLKDVSAPKHVVKAANELASKLHRHAASTLSRIGRPYAVHEQVSMHHDAAAEHDKEAQTQ